MQALRPYFLRGDCITLEPPTAIERDLEWIKKTLETMERGLEKIPTDTERIYVTKAEFEPIKRVVYGIVTLILSAVVMAIVAQVLVSK